MEMALTTAISLIVGTFLGFFFSKKLNKDSDNLRKAQDEIISMKTSSALLQSDIKEFSEKFTKVSTALEHVSEGRDEFKKCNLALSSELIELKEQRASFEAEKESLHLRIKEQKEETEGVQRKFKEEINTVQEKIGNKFEVLANKIFEEKNTKFKADSRESLENLLTPLKENIDHLKKEITDKYDKENENRIRLEQEIKNLTGLSATLSKDANNLSTALSGSVKAQGNWGEVVLERVLKHSGLKEGIDYIREGRGLGLKDEANRHQKPDVIINLPDDKHLIIDSKVTLNAYTRYISSKNDSEREKFLVEFIYAFKQRINELSGKSYELLDKLVTPEYILMFTPIEGALSLAMEKDSMLFEYGWERRIILVGPTNLLATLKAVESVWRQSKQEDNALKIAVQGGKLYDKFVGFVDDMKDIKKHLNKTDQAYGEAFKKLSSGQGNLITQVENMKKLGAKAKKSISSDLIEKNNESESLLE